MLYLPAVMLFGGTMAFSRTRLRSNPVEFQVHNLGAYHTQPLGSIKLNDLTWNITKGPPPRGWYSMKYKVDHDGQSSNYVIKKSGETGVTVNTFDFDLLPEAHYCRYRNSGTDHGEQCCSEEDENCFTVAGCFCDKACFTTYGDCCTDHYVTCYDDLKLCLHSGDEPKSKGGVDPEHEDMKKALAPKSKKPDLLHDLGLNNSPSRVEPDSCCGTISYNQDEECCIEEKGKRKTKTGSYCEEVVEEVEEEGQDDRLRVESPDPTDEEEEY